ncbi:MAG TPA: hypothetical protein VH595_08075 [Verrucomicrobiae bacterium]|jgi:hypothetical protein|nr:hypothetical protein [Verrucomicrobiae bacterium]
MSPQEARNAITSLIGALRRSSLEWVVREVSIAIERGIEERGEVSFELFDDVDQPISNRRGRKTEVTITRPLTDLEELRLLLFSIRAAIVDASDIQDRALRDLQLTDAPNPVIVFRPDVPEGFEDKGYSVADAGRGHPFEMTLEGIDARRDSLEKIRHLLKNLEDLVNAD